MLAMGTAFSIAIALLTGCSPAAETGIASVLTETASLVEKKSSASSMNIPQTGWTEAVPNEYLTSSGQPGTVERLDYESRDFLRDGGNITKTAYVYLPYGYDESGSERYDILYLMHG